jgi:uncharacterized protein (DUF302 family)
MEKLESVINEKGIKVFSKIDHWGNARDVGMEMNESQVIIFGNPRAGTVLMRENIFLSLDLPLRIAVLEDDSGDVWVVYNEMDALKTKYDLQDSEILVKVDKLLNTITDSATE